MISTRNQQLQTNNSLGFTLIELLVVLGIIILISSMVIPNISSYFQVSLSSATRDLASTIKEAYNSAVITGKVHRMVYNFKERSFRVESGPNNVMLDTKVSKEKREMRMKFSRHSDAPPKSEFALEKSVTRKKVTLPLGVEFEDIITQQSQNPITEGVAYTHLFPSGMSEQTIIHLKDSSKHHVSLAITSLLGMTDLYDRYVNATEAYGDRKE
jgi:Tfp pilus assembly protein PilE